MYITDERFFCSELSSEYPGLSEIGRTYTEKGVKAAEKELADFVRSFIKPDDYFKIPYYERENLWALDSDDDFAAAEKIISGELRSCGVSYKFPNPQSVDWEFNPTYNGYAEWTWQLSRHHEWRCLGQCYRQTGDEKYAKAFSEYLMSWCSQAVCPENAPSGSTHCWRTIEAGVRMTKNWHYAFHAFIGSEYLTDHVITTYMKSIWEHGYRLYTRATGGNWLIMEMAGLSHIVMLYPFLKNAPEWGRYAFGRLESELDVQVYPDGFQHELSTNYHDVVIQNYHWVMCTADAIGYKVPAGFSEKLERMFMLDINIMCPDRRYPDLNDGSRSRVKHWCTIGMKYFRENQQIRYFATDGKEGELPRYTSVALPYAGQAYMRTGWGENDIWLFMDAGPFGTGHQHEDKLNVLMYAYGKNVMPDSGNYAYDTSAMRRFVLETYSHNCGLVDDCGQSRRAKYRWMPEMIKKRSDMKWSFSKSVDSAEGIYSEGYGKELINVTQRRKVIFFKKGIAGLMPFAIVIDRYVSGDMGEHKFTTSYQMDIQNYTVNGKIYTANHGDGVTMNIIGSCEPSVILAQKNPYFIGWRKKQGADSEDFEHNPAPCLQYTAYGTKKRIVTVLYPHNGNGDMINDVVAREDINDTFITLYSGGEKITVDENDYICLSDADEKLMS